MVTLNREPFSLTSDILRSFLLRFQYNSCGVCCQVINTLCQDCPFIPRRSQITIGTLIVPLPRCSKLAPRICTFTSISDQQIRDHRLTPLNRSMIHWILLISRICCLWRTETEHTSRISSGCVVTTTYRIWTLILVSSVCS